MDTEAEDVLDVAPVDLTPTLTVDPAFLDCGFVNAGDELIANVTYTNTGAVDVGLTFLEVEGEGLSFSYGDGELFFMAEGTDFNGAPDSCTRGRVYGLLPAAPDSIAPAVGMLRMTYGDADGSADQILEVPMGEFQDSGDVCHPGEGNFRSVVEKSAPCSGSCRSRKRQPCPAQRV